MDSQLCEQSTIKRGILTGFDPTTYTCEVLLLESTNSFLSGVPIACYFDSTSAQMNALCAVLFFDEQNHTDAAVIAVYPNGSQGVPVPPPGRTTFVAGYRQVSNDTIASGSTNTYSLTGVGGIPAAALGVVFKAYYASPTVGAYVHLFPHGAASNAYITLGNTPSANSSVNGNGVLQLSSDGRIDVMANVGSITFTLYTYGYIM